MSAQEDYPSEEVPIWYCTIGTCDPRGSLFNYRPSLGANAAFAAIFGIFLVLGPIYAWRFRTYNYNILIWVGCLGEVAGYVGRILGYNNPWNMDYFLLQICALTISPTLLAAGIYVTLSKVVTVFGPDLSRIQPKTYTWLFLCLDLISLILQGTGGGMAATAGKEQENNDTGNWIMIAGLIFQVVTLTFFIAMCSEFAWKVKKNGRTGVLHNGKQGKKLKIFLVSLAVATLFILIRCIFRIAELWDGWSGKIMSNQTDFIVFEGVMVAIAAFLLTVVNPGWGIGDGEKWGGIKWSRSGEKNVESSSTSGNSTA
ncbi:RTA1-domain-containing protein [Ascobolus immersus RN42]|uniref:RTA1-domain-containing protein n=1 Tax=Ascobolus immersus RN42 TaxID=1160509 RepID=A0A3N4I9L9_ASCIM|nr:RTA1-domain-containing protein [Ascobolus immersus RN42]